MAIHNENNRPSSGFLLGDLTVDGSFYTIFHADKDVVIKAVSVVTIRPLRHDATNHVEFFLSDLSHDGEGAEEIDGTRVSTEGGLESGQDLVIPLPNDGHLLPNHHTLVLNMDVSGTGTFPSAFVSTDYLVKGN